MTLKHNDIWRAIDRLAEKHGLSPSGLAKKAGLSPTVFNTSKRTSASRKRWPSTESIAHIMRATDTKLAEFVALAQADGEMVRATLPIAELEAVRGEGAFDNDGQPAGKNWRDITFPAITDPHAFALEISGEAWDPIYRAGTRILISPSEKPRRGDRLAVHTSKGDIILGTLGRESARSIEILALIPGQQALVLSTNEVEWMCRIVWASQ